MLASHSPLLGLFVLGVALANALPYNTYDQYYGDAWKSQQVNSDEYYIGQQQRSEPRIEELRQAEESQQFLQSDDLSQENQQDLQSDDLTQESQQYQQSDDLTQESQQYQQSDDLTQGSQQYQQSEDLSQDTQQDQQSDDLTQESQQYQQSDDLSQESQQYQQSDDLTKETQQDQSEDLTQLNQQDQESDDLIQQTQQSQDDQVSGWDVPSRPNEGLERVRDQQSSQYTQGESVNDEWGSRQGNRRNDSRNTGNNWNSGNSGAPGNSWNNGNSGAPGNSWNGGNTGNSWNSGSNGTSGNSWNNSNSGTPVAPGNSWNSGNTGNGNFGPSGTNFPRPRSPPADYQSLPVGAATPLGFYKVHTKPKTWTEALMICVSEGAELVFPRSKQESTEIGNKYSSVKKDVKGSSDRELFFVGASDYAKEGDFVTLAGDRFSGGFYHMWQKGEPNNHSKDEHCVLSNDKGLYWDGKCSAKNAFICRFKPDPCAQPPRPFPYSDLETQTTY